MNVVMDEVESLHFEVLRRAIDTELKDLAIWTIPRVPNLDFRTMFFGLIDLTGSSYRKSRIFPYKLAARSPARDMFKDIY